MTWGSFLTRSLSLILVLPLVLTRLSTEELAVWYLFSTVIGLQSLADTGFSPTFARVIAYAMGGSRDFKDLRNATKVQGTGQPDWEIMERICSTMRVVYRRLTFLSMSLLTIIGTWAMIKPISATKEPTSAWLAWGIILLSSTINIQGNIYTSYIQGVNKIALLQRWAMFTSLGSISTSFLVIISGGRLLELVIANQSWLMLNILRNRWLCRTVEGGCFQKFIGRAIDKEVFDSVWPSAVRSGVGLLMGNGISQASALIYAQVGSAGGVASYLLALRLMSMVTQFCKAPFYSKLPTLARLRSEGKLAEQVQIAKRGMSLTYWLYVVGFIGLGIFAAPLLKLLGSNAEFVSPLLWVFIGLSLFAERYGGMHIQLYSTTNHIIWHIANGVSGVIYLLTCLALFKSIGVYAFPLASLAGYLGFYCWYSAQHSYKAFGLNFWSFERSTMLMPFIGVLIYCIGVSMLSLMDI